MPTYRCLNCRALYATPQEDRATVFHACGPKFDPATGKLVPDPGRRDENIVQDPETGTVTMKAAGIGRELVSPDNILAGTTPADLPALHALPAIGASPLPEPAPVTPDVWPSRGTNR